MADLISIQIHSSRSSFCSNDIFLEIIDEDLTQLRKILDNQFDSHNRGYEKYTKNGITYEGYFFEDNSLIKNLDWINTVSEEKMQERANFWKKYYGFNKPEPIIRTKTKKRRTWKTKISESVVELKEGLENGFDKYHIREVENLIQLLEKHVIK